VPEIPSDIATSAAQAGFLAREVGKDREASRAGQVHAANRQVKALDEAGATVETTDADSRVFTDAEGGGSQGRFAEDESSETSIDENPIPPDDKSGVTRDDTGHFHVDLEA